MFIDKKYKCITSTEVLHEIYQTQKFKEKYPWRKEVKDKIIPDNKVLNKNNEFTKVLDIIDYKLVNGVFNKITNRYIDLSFVDKIIASYVITYNLNISSADNNLRFMTT